MLVLPAFVPGVAKSQESHHLCTGLCLISLLILFPESLIAITPGANVTHTAEASAETGKTFSLLKRYCSDALDTSKAFPVDPLKYEQVVT